MDSLLNGDFELDEGDDLSDYDPNEELDSKESDSYDSEDSGAEFLNEDERADVQAHENIALMSKDKTIQYSLEPPPISRPPASRVGSIANEGSIFSSIVRKIFIGFVLKGPTTYASARATDSLASFLMIIEPIEKIVLDMTNLYGRRRYKDKWIDLDIFTMRAYYGLLLLAGVYRSRGEDISELWDDHKGRPIFRATMSLKMFKLINQCIRFDDKEERMRTNDRHKLEPIRNVFEKWVQRMRALYVPGKYLTVDEQLLPFRGRCPFIQYIPNKPAKYGIKIWIVCDSKTYYAYNLEVYVGRNRNTTPEVNLGERVVLTLTDGLNGSNVTADNLFISVSLAKKLKERQMTLVGTIRKNRKEILPILLNMKGKPAEHSEFLFDHKLRTTMVTYVPKRNRFVSLLSTYHTNKAIDVNDKKKPEIIKFYNETKGAVDTLDEMVGTYRCKRRVLRWPLALFENMLDISACNALVIFLANNPHWPHANKKARRRYFLIEVGEALVSVPINKRKRMPTGKRARDVVCDMQGIPREESPAPSSSTSSSARASPVPWLSNLKHTEPTKKRARCHICPYASNTTAVTARCDKCQRAVCPQHRFQICESCCGITQ